MPRLKAFLVNEPTTALLALVFIIALLAGQVLGATAPTTLLARAAIFALAALSLSFILGQGGMVSLGHAAPMGLGAYVTLSLAMLGIKDFFLVMTCAFIVGAAFSALTGLIALRTRGVYFIMITLAFAQMAFYAMSSLSVFGGTDGIALPVRSTLFGWPLLRSDGTTALVALVLLVTTFWGLSRVTRSRFGMALRASHLNETKFTALGFEPLPYRLLAYSLAGGLSALAGVLLANLTDYIAPSFLDWHRSGELIVMVVLGGVTRPFGAILGAFALIYLESLVGGFTQYWNFVLGLILLAIVLLRSRFEGAARVSP